MLKTFRTALALATFAAGLASGAAWAANGCGRGYFRTMDGACIPNQQVEGPRGVRRAPPCPPGFLRDPDPARPLCYPVY